MSSSYLKQKEQVNKSRTLISGHIAVQNIVNASDRNPLVSIPKTANLLDAVKMFVEHNIHRIAVLESEQKCCGILSESFIANLISSKYSKFSNTPEKGTWTLGNKSVEELGIIKTKLVTVQDSDLVIDALHHMHEAQISSIAIVGPQGQGSNKVTNTLIKDLRYNLHERH